MFVDSGDMAWRTWRRMYVHPALNPPYVSKTDNFVTGRSSQGFQSVLISILSLMNQDPVFSPP